MDTPTVVITAVWVVFMLIWLLTSFAAKRIAKGEGGAGIARRVLTIAVGWFLLVRADDPRLGILSHRFLHYSLGVSWFATGMVIVGVAFALWARVHIGRYWSATVALKADHQLIRTGPYARIRHPIYTGIILALAGTALNIGRYSAILAVAIYAIAFWIKARKEEALLAGEFGPAFEQHRHDTGFFLPRLSH